MGEFWIAREGKKHGPYPEDQVRRNYASGRVLPTDLVWTEGMADWKAASQAFGPVPARRAPSVAAPATPYQPPAAVVRDEADAALGDDVTYAGFWVRFGALILDNLIVYAILIVVALVVGFGVGRLGGSDWAGIAGMIVWLGFFVVAFFYFTLMESGERGATLGKRAFRLRVVTSAENARIGFWRAVGRFFAHGLSAIVFYVGYLMQPFTQRKQALHDMISGTVVVALAPASRVMIAVAIIVGLIAPVGIMAAIAVPAYHDYTVRAKVSEALLAASPARNAVHTYLSERNAIPKTLAEAGVKVPSSARVQSITIDPRNAALTVTLAFSPLAGRTILLVPERAEGSAINWKCRPGTTPRKYLPASCRNS